MKDLAERGHPSNRWPMKMIARARLAVNGPFTWIQAKDAENDVWMDLVETKPVIIAQGFVTVDDFDTGGEYNLLSDPNNGDSEAIQVEGVIFAPQAAMLMIRHAAGQITGAMGSPVPVPTVEEAQTFLAEYRKRNTFV